MSVNQKIDYVRLEEALNRICADPRIRGRRTAQADMVRSKLRIRIQGQLAKLEFPEAMQQAYLAGDKAAEAALAALLPGLLSQRKLTRFRFLQGRKRSLALEFLKEECLLEKEQVRFRKETGLGAKVWLKFYNSTALSDPQTLEIIKDALKLTQQERAEFDALLLREVFPATDPLKLEVHARRKETGMAILEFINYACVGKDAWEAFYPIPTEDTHTPPEALHNTSQDTLLKLVIGFQLTEAEAWDFLELVKSGFYRLRDQVFLACIRENILLPDTVSAVLDFFAEGPDGEVLYTNPYARFF